VDYASGSPVAVLAECVYFRDRLPRKLQRAAYTSATSSGVAAAGDREQAIERAVLELVERDAFMAAWLERRETSALARGSLPRSLQTRVAALEDLGFRVAFKDLSRGLAPVVLAFAQHADRGMTSLATHAAFDPEAALEHALSELESMVYLRLRNDRRERISPSEVRTPRDHAALYAQRRYFRRADHLASATNVCALSSVGRRLPGSWPALLDALRARGHRVVCVDVTPQGARLSGDARPLHVVRAIVTGLLPMTFGCGLEPLGLLPAGGNETLFPHPFA
jgi:ribosomal protein S12 methylthiotransferase accessory factor